MPFADRSEAGRKLAGRLEHLRGRAVVVLGVARGGVPVAFEVARALGAPLDVMLVRKLGVPRQPELGMGAIGEEGARILNDEVIREAGVSAEQLAEVEDRERAQLDSQARRFRGDRSPLPLQGHVAVVVDDGIATGSTALAACRAASARGAERVVLAVPLASPAVIAELAPEVDEMVFVDAPVRLWAVGQWYRDFSQIPDDEVTRLLHGSAQQRATP